ncbi:site-specific integrase [Streptomyces sp. NPDC048196]|uniref:site-specific integrase n=1 Tax=Streptomyces sp. NPDC048196 TaxID=3154712 RepID=UPI0033F1964F
MENIPYYAKLLREYLVGIYGPDDSLPDLAADWIARYPSPNTQRSYNRSFRLFVAFARRRGIHPMQLESKHAHDFAAYLTTVTGREDKPLSSTSRRSMLSAASTFYQHWYTLKGDYTSRNPFADVPRS